MELRAHRRTLGGINGTGKRRREASSRADDQYGRGLDIASACSSDNLAEGCRDNLLLGRCSPADEGGGFTGWTPVREQPRHDPVEVLHRHKEDEGAAHPRECAPIMARSVPL